MAERGFALYQPDFMYTQVFFTTARYTRAVVFSISIILPAIDLLAAGRLDRHRPVGIGDRVGVQILFDIRKCAAGIIAREMKTLPGTIPFILITILSFAA